MERMPYCVICGNRIDEDAVHCANCGTRIPLQSEQYSRVVLGSKYELADWGTRFIAWLIDMIILGIIFSLITLPGLNLIPQVLSWVPFIDFGSKNIIYFGYWTFMEGLYSQSIGKMALKIKTVQEDGNTLNLVIAAIESFGKAFLLPIDCIIGWIFYSQKNQRLFNYISNTIVVKDNEN